MIVGRIGTFGGNTELLQVKLGLSKLQLGKFHLSLTVLLDHRINCWLLRLNIFITNDHVYKARETVYYATCGRVTVYTSYWQSHHRGTCPVWCSHHWNCCRNTVDLTPELDCSPPSPDPACETWMCLKYDEMTFIYVNNSFVSTAAKVYVVR